MMRKEEEGEGGGRAREAGNTGSDKPLKPLTQVPSPEFQNPHTHAIRMGPGNLTLITLSLARLVTLML